MLSHYIKISFRELLKYRTQSIVSIIGLAVGFTAFILGGYWLRWETHFDNFHPNGDRLYCLTTSGLNKTATGADADLNQLHINDLAEIKKLVPEIEQVCILNDAFYNTKINNTTQTVCGIVCDHTFFDFFKADFIAGTYQGTYRTVHLSSLPKVRPRSSSERPIVLESYSNCTSNTIRSWPESLKTTRIIRI